MIDLCNKKRSRYGTRLKTTPIHTSGTPALPLYHDVNGYFNRSSWPQLILRMRISVAWRFKKGEVK